MSEGPVLQDPGETRKHSIDWSDWLGTDTISSAAWTIFPTGGNITSPAPTNTTTLASCYASGLTLGQIYTLKCAVTTALGEVGDDSIVIRCFPK